MNNSISQKDQNFKYAWFLQPLWQIAKQQNKTKQNKKTGWWDQTEDQMSREELSINPSKGRALPKVLPHLPTYQIQEAMAVSDSVLKRMQAILAPAPWTQKVESILNGTNCYPSHPCCQSTALKW